ncbi:MAG: NADH-quinone oxidoreductase subunit C [Chitinophagaceae bacterium]
MTNDDILQKLQAKFGQTIQHIEEPYGMLTFEAPKEDNLKILSFLKDDPSLQFTYLNDLTVVHYPEQIGKELCVVYLLQNIYTKTRIRFKTYTDIITPEVYTATSLYATANWLEREAYDFFGVQFIGHPNLIRIMNVEEMDYHPLRKEFPLEDQTRSDKDDDMFGR